jgi:CubicO group peptidase (beta-lactamase class C family)
VDLPAPFRGAALVAQGSRVLLEDYAGFADASAGVATDASSRFQISSISKQFVAACVLLLADDGSLTIDDPVSGWFDRSPRSWDAVRIENLLTHTAGFGQWTDYPDIDPGAAITDDAFVAALQARPLPDDLPAAHAYSAPGYGLLVRIVEEASGKTYTKFVTERILNPLRMRDTFVGSAHQRTAIARGYHGDDPVPSWELDTAGRGTGDVWSTVRDLDKWDQALLTDALLPTATRDAMFAPHAPIDGGPNINGYGYGWVVGRLHGQPLYLHPGNNPGYASFNAVMPIAQLRVILLGNDETADALTIGMDLIEIALS